LFRRSERIQDNELRDLAQKIRQANKLREQEDSQLSVVSEHHMLFDRYSLTKTCNNIYPVM